LLEAFGAGLMSIFQWPAFSFMLIGIAIGFVVGILPGLGSGTALVLMLPHIFRMEPVQAFAFLLGMASVVATTGDITSILFGVPGESDCAASIIDGHPMSRNGEAGRALGASLMSSLIGAVFGGLVLAMAVPVVRPLVLSFGSPGVFMLCILGLISVASLGGGNTLKGLIAGGLGIFFALVGLDRFTATPRYTLGQLYLWDGIPLVPATIGLFAIPEVVNMAVMGGSIARGDVGKIGGITEGVKDAFRHWKLVLRCSGIGALIGIMPGIGSGVAQFLAYAHAVQSSPDKERFGKGAVEGVLGPGAANNSKEGGALIPAVTFGVPGGLHTAILLGAFTILGLTPGLAMLRPEQNLSLTYSFVWTIVVANVIVVPASFLLLRQLVWLTRVRVSLLIPNLLMFIFIGSFARNTFGDVITMLLFGVLGLLMVWFDWSRPPLLIGLVLGAMLEKTLFISVDAYGTLGWLGRPVVVILTLVIFAIVFLSVVKRLRQRKNREKFVVTGHRAFSWGALFSLAMAVFFALAIWDARTWPSRARIFPMAIFVPVLMLALVNLVKELRHPRKKAVTDVWTGSPMNQDLVRRRTAGIIAWILGFFLATWGFGFLLGFPLAIFLFLKVASRESWTTSILITSGSWAFIVILFVRLLHFPFPEGQLFELITGLFLR